MIHGYPVDIGLVSVDDYNRRRLIMVKKDIRKKVESGYYQTESVIEKVTSELFIILFPGVSENIPRRVSRLCGEPKRSSSVQDSQ